MFALANPYQLRRSLLSVGMRYALLPAPQDCQGHCLLGVSNNQSRYDLFA
jgi:hypothetical protein